MNKLPTEMILHQISFMDNTSIKNLCKSNIRIYSICKNNKDFIKKIYYNNVLTKEQLKFNHFDIRKEYLELNKSNNRIEQFNDKGYPTLYYIMQRCIIEKFYDMIYIIINSLSNREKNIFIEQSKNKEYNINWTHPILQSIRRFPDFSKDYLKLVPKHLDMIYLLCKFYNCNNINLITNIIDKFHSNKLNEKYVPEGKVPKYQQNKYRYEEYVNDRIMIKDLSYNIKTNSLYYIKYKYDVEFSDDSSSSDSESSDSDSDIPRRMVPFVEDAQGADDGEWGGNT